MAGLLVMFMVIIRFRLRGLTLSVTEPYPMTVLSQVLFYF